MAMQRRRRAAQLADGLLGCWFDAVCHYDLSALLPRRFAAARPMPCPAPVTIARPCPSAFWHLPALGSSSSDIFNLPEFLRVTLVLRRTFGVGRHV